MDPPFCSHSEKEFERYLPFRSRGWQQGIENPFGPKSVLLRTACWLAIDEPGHASLDLEVAGLLLGGSKSGSGTVYRRSRIEHET